MRFTGLFILGVFFVLLLVGVAHAIDSNDPKYCEDDSDCVLAVNASACCTACPIVISKDTFDAYDYLVEPYSVNYSTFDKLENCTGKACVQGCPSINVLNCEDNECVGSYVEENETEDNETTCMQEGEMCGGIAGFVCCDGLECEYDVNEGMPDASGTCIVEEHENETEVEDDDNETEIEDDKVCCLRVRFNGSKMNESKYNYIERGDCASSGGFRAEIVGDDMCERFRHMEKWSLKEKIRERFENKTGVECPDECKCRGSVITCELEDGSREMTVYAGRSGNVIVQVKGVNVSTNVTLYKDENNSLVGVFDGVEKKIKVYPDQAMAKLKERIRARLSDLKDTGIELGDDGNYEIQTGKKARLFWIIPVTESVDAEINSQNGELVRLKNSWWGFLANDVEEESE